MIVFATLLRVIVGARLPLVPDETYYWEWSRHLSLGYFDHPPIIAWLIRIGTEMFGINSIGVRILPIVCGGVAALAIAATGRRVAGAHTAAEAAIIISAMPLAAAGLVLATSDAPLLAAVATALFFLVKAIQAERRSPNRFAPGAAPASPSASRSGPSTRRSSCPSAFSSRSRLIARSGRASPSGDRMPPASSPP